MVPDSTLITNLETALQTRIHTITYTSALTANAEVLRLAHILLKSPLCTSHTSRQAVTLTNRLITNTRSFYRKYRLAQSELQAQESCFSEIGPVSDAEICAGAGAGVGALAEAEISQGLNRLQQAQLSYIINAHHRAAHASSAAQVERSHKARRCRVRGILLSIPWVANRFPRYAREFAEGVGTRKWEETGEELVGRLEAAVKRAEEVTECLQGVHMFWRRMLGGATAAMVLGKGEEREHGEEEEGWSVIEGEDKDMLLQFWEWNLEEKHEDA